MTASELKRMFPTKLTVIRSKAGFLVATALVLAAVPAACGGSSPTATVADTQPQNTIAVATPTPQQQAVTSEVLSSTTSSLPTATAVAEPVAAAELDANDIVAAQEQVLVNIYQDLLPSVVHIRVSSKLNTGSLSPSNPRIPPAQDPRDFFQQGEGSGFIWDNDGHIVTNNHVIQDADRVIVTFFDRAQIEAKVIGTDPDSDLAVLELEEKKEGSRPVTLGDSDTLQVGQMAVAIGNPFGQQFTMTTGIVSALGRTINSSNSGFSIPEVALISGHKDYRMLARYTHLRAEDLVGRLD